MKYSITLTALLTLTAARDVNDFAQPRAHPRDVRSSHLSRREVPQEHSHQKFLTAVTTSLNLNNPNGIVDPVFGLLGNGAAAKGLGKITDTECLQSATADQAFTNAKAAGDVTGMTAALIYRALERNTGQVGLKSNACTSIPPVHPEIAAISQHQDPASTGAAATNKAITLALAKQIASIGGTATDALQAGTFAPGKIGDPTAKGNTCDNANDPVGCIFTQKLLVEDATADEINAAVAGTSAVASNSTVVASNSSVPAGTSGQVASNSTGAAVSSSSSSNSSSNGGKSGKGGKDDNGVKGGKADKSAGAGQNIVTVTQTVTEVAAAGAAVCAAQTVTQCDTAVAAMAVQTMAAAAGMTVITMPMASASAGMGMLMSMGMVPSPPMDTAAAVATGMGMAAPPPPPAAAGMTMVAPPMHTAAAAAVTATVTNSASSAAATVDCTEAIASALAAAGMSPATNLAPQPAAANSTVSAATKGQGKGGKGGKANAGGSSSSSTTGTSSSTTVVAAACSASSASSASSSSNSTSTTTTTTTGTSALDLGSCTNPTIIFANNLDGRNEPSFAPADETTFTHGSALGIKVITDFICQQLGTKCKAGAATLTACNQGAAAAQKATGQAAADAFNQALGF